MTSALGATFSSRGKRDEMMKQRRKKNNPARDTIKTNRTEDIFFYQICIEYFCQKVISASLECVPLDVCVIVLFNIKPTRSTRNANCHNYTPKSGLLKQLNAINEQKDILQSIFHQEYAPSNPRNQRRHPHVNSSAWVGRLQTMSSPSRHSLGANVWGVTAEEILIAQMRRKNTRCQSLWLWLQSQSMGHNVNVRTRQTMRMFSLSPACTNFS